ncbi:MAG: hypothetical protein ACYC92_00360 [Candidatus Acidiferrales bacterium]
MRTFVICGVVVFVSCALGVSAKTHEDARTAAVHVVVVDGLGQGNLQGGKIKSFKNLQTGRDLAASFHVDRFLDQTAAKVPFGHYELVLSQPGFPDAERPVDVFASDVNVEVCVRTATVHVLIVGAFTHDKLPIQVESFKSREDDFDLAKRFKGGTGIKIPYGTYDLRVTMPYAREARRRVDVFQPGVWVVVELEFASEGPAFRAPQWIVTGSVTNIKPDEAPIYVSLVGIHATYRIDDKVKMSGSSGTFKLAGFIPEVRFLLITSGQSGVLDIRQIKIPRDNPVVIDLAKKEKQPMEQH